MKRIAYGVILVLPSEFRYFGSNDSLAGLVVSGGVLQLFFYT